MSYKTEFINDSKAVFADVVKAKRINENAKNLIDEYFVGIFDSLKEEEGASGRALRFERRESSWVIGLSTSSLTVLYNYNRILVNVKETGFGKEEILSIENDSFYSEKHKAVLSEELLNQYMKAAFDKTLQRHLEKVIQ